MRQVDMIRLDLSTGKAEKTQDCIAEEVPLQISSNDAYHVCEFGVPLHSSRVGSGLLIGEEIFKVG